MNRLAILIVLFALAAPAFAAPRVTSPKEFFGHDLCDDYKLVNFTELTAYWMKLDAESDRLQLREIGKTAEGRTMLMAVISSPRNLRSVERHRQNAKRLALAEGLTDAEARKLAGESKAIVWIDGGLHATEVVAGQQIIQLVYEMCSRDDREVRDILDNVILLACLVNPDGLELVANWYREHQNTRVPRLYQKYIGHDNNRDFYMTTQPESVAINNVFYREWFPQIVYNQHQTAPAGTVIATPPFRNPFNYNFDPLVMRGTDLVGAFMNNRFSQEGKPGAISRTQFSTWFNGGLRTTAYFHNMIGILTETAHASPAPGRITPRADQLIPTADYPHPITAQDWTAKKSLGYCMTGSYGVLDVAAKYREQFLYNIYQMGRNSIERGKTESPRTYVVPSDQPDFPTATKFINALIRAGIVVHHANAPFVADGKSFPAGSLVIDCAQAFRPHIKDMFEPQKHPNDLRYPGGPPIPPYDSAGWTLAMQMGVKFERVSEAPATLWRIDGIDLSVNRLEQGLSKGGRWSAVMNDSFTAVNRQFAKGEEVFRLPGGDFFIAQRAATAPRPEGLKKMTSPRLGLFDYYGGSMASGWTRWLFEQFEFPYKIVWGAEIDAGDLRSKYDVIVLPSGTTGFGGRGGFGGTGLAGAAPTASGDAAPAAPATLPKGYEERTRLSARSFAQLKQFVEDGGTLIGVGTASDLGQQLGLPVRNVLRGKPNTEFYCPGSVLEVNVKNDEPLAWGMGTTAHVMFDGSPAFEVTDSSKVKVIASYGATNPLRSGWILGESNLFSRAAIVEVSLGKGKAILMGPEVTFRAQPHGTFKLLFNAILNSASMPQL